MLSAAEATLAPLYRRRKRRPDILFQSILIALEWSNTLTGCGAENDQQVAFLRSGLTKIVGRRQGAEVQDVTCNR